MTEIYIFSQDDKLIDTLTESTGLIETHFREELNRGSSFTFTVNAGGGREAVSVSTVESERNLTQSTGSFIGTMGDITQHAKKETSPTQYVVEENQVVFRDKEGDLRLYVIKEIDDVDNVDGPQTTAVCEPAFMELRENIIDDRRFINQTASVALNAALLGTRWAGTVELSLGNATTNFYYIDSVDAIWDVIDKWGGEFKDVVEFSGNKITARKIILKQRRGVDRGKRFEIDHDIEEIQRTVLSYPVTAIYGRGSSLEIEDDEGEHTGGYTRLIDFADVVWKKSSGDPVDKPKGQKWVGDPEALTEYGRLHNGKLLHRETVWENGDYEDPLELLHATWIQLQAVKKPEVNYQMSVYLLEQIAGYEHEKVALGDTAFAIDRDFSRSIEIQARVIAIEYDIMDIENTAAVEMGQFLSVHDVDLGREIDDLKDKINNPKPTPPITDGSFPDIVPGVPVNVKAVGGFQAIQLYWEYDSKVYISHYEVFGSQVADFVPSSQHLLYRGRVSAFAHTVETDQAWYYYLRAVNTNGTASAISGRVSSSTVRIITDDILFGSIIADHLSNNLDIADKLAQNTIDRINAGPMLAIQYTDDEVAAVENRLLADLAGKVGAEYVDGKLTSKLDSIDFQNAMIDVNTDLNTINASVVDITGDINELTGEVTSARAQIAAIDIKADGIRSSVTDIRTDLTGTQSQLAEIDIKADGIRSTVNNIQIGGRNLVPNSANLLDWSRWSLNTTVTKMAHGMHQVRRVTPATGGVIGIHSNAAFILKAGNQYTLSYKAHDFYDASPNYIYILSSEQGNTQLSNSSIENLGRTGTLVNQSLYANQYKLTFTFAKDVKDGQILIGYNGGTTSHPNIGFYISDVQLEKGNQVSDWSPSPEDDDARMTKSESGITQLSDNIALKVDKDGVVASINLSPEGVRFNGNLHHITGQTLIDDAVIGTAAIANLSVTNAKIGTLAVDTAQIRDAAIKNAKIGNLAVDDAKIANLSVTKLLAGEIDTSKIKIRGGSAIDYMLIDGGDFATHGQFTRTWGGETDTARLRLGLFGGRVRVTNDTTGYNLYMTEKGLSTTMSGASEISAGTLEFHSQRYNTVSRGVTLHSTYGTAALVSEFSTVVSQSELSNNIDSMTAGVYIRPMRSTRAGNNEFVLRVKDNPSSSDTDGWISYGSPLTGFASGIRFKKSSTGNPEIHATNGGGDKGTGNFVARQFEGELLGNVRAVSTNAYGMVAYDGEFRVTDKNGYNDGNMTFRPVVAMEFRPQSSEDYKTDITPWTDNVLSTIVNDTQMYQYVLKQQKGTLEERTRHGVIIERETPADIVAGKGIDLYEYGSYAMKGLQEAGALLFVHNEKINTNEDDINWLKTENQLLYNKIRILEENAT